jgi:hypothetical protein
MSEIEELVAAVNGLQQVAQELRDRSDVQDKVLARLDKLTRYGQTNRKGVVVATAAVALSLIVGGFAVYLDTRLTATTHQLQQVQARTSVEVLCPLYQVFALSLQVNAAPSNYTPAQIDVRRRATEAIVGPNGGLAKLGCGPA